MHQQSGWTATPSRLIGAPTSTISTIFMPDALLDTTLPIYLGLGQASNMLACIHGGLVRIPGCIPTTVQENPNVTWEELRHHPPWQRTTTPQSTHWLQWDAQHISAKTAPSFSTIFTPMQYTHPLTNPTHHPKQHSDSISRFATVHFPDRQTNRWDCRQVCKNTRLCSIDSEWRSW